MNKMLDILKTAPDHASITFDCWSDNAKQRAFIGYTYHFVDTNWEMRTAVLKVTAMQRPHTGERLKDNFQETLNEFGLSHKNISVVTDCGSNVIKCARLLNVNRAACVTHGIHQLITTDLLKDDSMGEITNLLNKLRAIQGKLLYKYEELKLLDSQQKNQCLIDLMQRFAEAGNFCKFR